MKSKWAVIVGMMVMICFLFAGAGICTAEGEGKVNQPEWSKIVDSKVHKQIGDNAIINYEDGYIEALGIGAVDTARIKGTNARPMCLRAAKVDGYRNLLEATKGVQVDSQTTVREFVTESDVINTAISGFVRGAQVINTDYLSDGTCEVTLRMSLRGELMGVFMPKAIAEPQKQPPPQTLAQAAPAPVTPAPGPVFTGLVVDARGLKARPAMSPKIVDETGAEVYGSMIVEKEYAVSQGISGYARDLTAAQGNQRVTNNPLTVKGVSAEGAGKADIKIGNDDAGRIRSAAENLSFMKQCRVMIVLD
jgi:hypothetical protein